ncbi:MAG TPA: hypothetical protein VFU49_12985, partial [Ktedonobacteraceae bacterium]|nr:hypothetical protein [Ktedonobacteraceae bacterium]
MGEPVGARGGVGIGRGPCACPPRLPVLVGRFSTVVPTRFSASNLLSVLPLLARPAPTETRYHHPPPG